MLNSSIGRYPEVGHLTGSGAEPRLESLLLGEGDRPLLADFSIAPLKSGRLLYAKFQTFIVR